MHAMRTGTESRRGAPNALVKNKRGISCLRRISYQPSSCSQNNNKNYVTRCVCRKGAQRLPALPELERRLEMAAVAAAAVIFGGE